MAMTPFIGVRISWLIAARKSDLARAAASAAVRAFISDRLRWISSSCWTLARNAASRRTRTMAGSSGRFTQSIAPSS